MNVRSASLLLFPALLAACSDDGSGPNTGDRLTRDEALMIATAVSGSVETTSATPRMSGQDRVASDPFTFTREHESTHPCPRGGNVALSWTVSGMADPEAGAFEFDVEGTHAASACSYRHQGLTISVTGDPDLDFAAHLALADHQPSEPFTASINGAFNWEASDGRSGHCVVEYAAVTDFQQRTRTVEGEVCGHTVEETFTWTD
jgi:hypothetical protein